jgi:hypothetical protein
MFPKRYRGRLSTDMHINYFHELWMKGLKWNEWIISTLNINGEPQQRLKTEGRTRKRRRPELNKGEKTRPTEQSELNKLLAEESRILKLNKAELILKISYVAFLNVLILIENENIMDQHSRFKSHSRNKRRQIMSLCEVVLYFPTLEHINRSAVHALLYFFPINFEFIPFGVLPK